jgi:SNF2 family DNA or RNA helicase
LVRIYTDREGAFESIIQRMQRTIVLVRNRAENMPELETINASYTMPSELEAMYLEMRAKAMLEMPDGSSAMALHKAAMVGKLCQISSGAIYNDDGGYTVLDRTRYQQIVRLVRKFGKSVVFFQWRHQAAELKKELEAAGFKVASMFTDKGALSNNQRNAVMDEFQKGDADVFLSHPKSSGHGITLTAAHAVIWVSPMADLELYLQGSARVHRKGQTKKTYLINVSAKNTGGSEGRMVALLTQKHQAQDQFFDALWAAIEGGGSHGDTSHS